MAASILLAGPARAEPAMWVIKDKDSTIYLIGTLHLLRHETEWNADKVKKAVADSTELWLEVADADNQAAIVPLIQKYGYDREKPLSSKLNAVQKAKLDKIAADYQIPVSSLEPMKPWMAALLLATIPLQKAGYDPNSGVDRLLKAQAEKEGDKIQGFETLEEQIRFLAELPETEQVAFLEDTFDDTIGGIALLDKLASAWMRGDDKIINDLLVNQIKEKAPVIYQKLLVQRNVQWAGKIAGILDRSGVQMIAIGAGHLTGPDSLQVQLAKRGIKVEPY
jgi:uncharacterized protein YbaP (TraB family)